MYVPIAFFAFDIWKAVAVARETVAVETLRIRSQNVARTFLANVVDGISVETGLAKLTVEAFGVEQTFFTFAGMRVAVSGFLNVPVV